MVTFMFGMQRTIGGRMSATSRVLKETKAHRVLREKMEPMVLTVNKALKALREAMVRTELMASRVHKALREATEPMVLMVNKVHRVLPDRMVQTELTVRMAHKVLKALRVAMVQTELTDSRALKVLMEVMAMELNSLCRWMARATLYGQVRQVQILELANMYF
jgi:hypothetical protein